ncbi:Crp/Fnr family transcriptional regulator [Derxia lacustris]|uniref:Crp/Fnr family transcriptional regulator n=1 Tax=Derxia lacustris TaxID=764842 RepID=UPI000A17428D|nr:Crp/Fnr family transcriptional regulator [Derxia lacustris]
MSTNVEMLRRVPLFYGLDDVQLELLTRTLVRKAFPKNRVIVTEGQPADNMFIIIAGRAKVQIADQDGKEVILAVLGPGEFFGEMSLIDNNPSSASVITIEQSHFIVVSKDDFRRHLAGNPEVAMNIMRGLVRRLRVADKKIETLALLDVYGRVARVLLDFSELIDGKRVVRHKLPARQEIAKMIGASREMVSRVMKDLETDGYFVERDDGTIVINEQEPA